MKLAFFGGIYNNSLALDAAIRDARSRGAERLYCLGDLGAFGPHPDRVFPLLREAGVACVQGNYDDSVGNDLDDCQCGYTDPRDNYYAQLSYDYTYRNTSAENRRWMRELPTEIRFEVDGLRFLLCHGSPRKTNEFCGNQRRARTSSTNWRTTVKRTSFSAPTPACTGNASFPTAGGSSMSVSSGDRKTTVPPASGTRS